MNEQRMEFLGTPLDPLTFSECVAAVDDAVAEGRQIVHTSVNAAKVVRAQHDLALREALWAADLSTADGQPIVWAARALGRAVPERVAGIDLMERLLAHAARRGYRVFLLGARHDVVEAAASEIRRRHREIDICGYRDGYFPPDEDEQVAVEIGLIAPHLLFVALATPRKEMFLAERRDELGAAFAMGVGGAFDVLAGRRQRAPRWAQRLGLEWLFRLAQDPRRLATRYAVGNVRFLALVLRELARRRVDKANEARS